MAQHDPNPSPPGQSIPLREIHDSGNSGGNRDPDPDCNRSDCKRIEELRQARDDSFHSVFDFINDGLLVLDQHGQLVDTNQIFCERLGYRKEELLGMHITELNDPNYNHLVPERMAQVNHQGQALFRSAHRHRDGRSIPVEISSRRIELKGEPMMFSLVRNLNDVRRLDRDMQMMQLSVDRMGDGAFWLSPEGRVTYANHTACQALGYSKAEILQLHVFDFDPSMRRENWQAHWEQARQSSPRTLESTHITRDGREIPVEITINHFSYDQEEFHCTFVRDISGRRQKQRALKMMQFAMDNMSDAVFWANAAGRIVYANIEACRSLNYTLDEMLSLHIHEIVPNTSAASWQEQWQQLTALRSHTFESSHRTRTGQVFPVEISTNHMQFEDEEYLCGFARDITLRKLTDDKIARLAHYDGLTGLPNRVLLYDRLELAIAQANRYRQQLAVLFLDLDGFKLVNDNYGHYIGDDLLKAVAAQLRDNARDIDTVARVGGDEFVFILNEIGQPEHAALVARKVINSLARPFMIHGKPCHISGSIGIALFPQDGGDMEAIIRQADDAMYVAKNSGKGCYQFANPQHQ